MTLRQSSSTGSLASLARERVQQQRPTAGCGAAGRNHTTSAGDVAEGTGRGSAMQERLSHPRSSQRPVDFSGGRDPFQQLLFERALLSSRYVNSSGAAAASGVLTETARAGSRTTIPAVRSTGNLNSVSSSRSTHNLPGHRHARGMQMPQSSRPSNCVLQLEASAAPLTSVCPGLEEVPSDPDPNASKASMRTCDADCDGNVSTSAPPSASTGERIQVLPLSGERILGEALEAAGMLQGKGPARKPYGSRLENKPLGFPLRHRSCSWAEKHRVMGTSPENGMANPRFVWGDWDGPAPERQLRQARPPPSAASPLSSANLQAHDMQQHSVVQRTTSCDRTGTSHARSGRSASSARSERSSRSAQKHQSIASSTLPSQKLSQSKSFGKEARSASQPVLPRPTWSELVAEGEQLGASLRAQAERQQSGGNC